MSVPDQSDVDALRDLLDLIEGWPSNDQKARFLLSSNWMRRMLDRESDPDEWRRP